MVITMFPDYVGKAPPPRVYEPKSVQQTSLTLPGAMPDRLAGKHYNKSRSDRHIACLPGKAKTTLKPAARSTGENQPSLPYSSTSIRPATDPYRAHQKGYTAQVQREGRRGAERLGTRQDYDMRPPFCTGVELCTQEAVSNRLDEYKIVLL